MSMPTDLFPRTVGIQSYKQLTQDLRMSESKLTEVLEGSGSGHWTPAAENYKIVKAEKNGFGNCMAENVRWCVRMWVRD